MKQSDSDAHDAYCRLSDYFAAIESGVAGLAWTKCDREPGAGVCWRSEDPLAYIYVAISCAVCSYGSIKQVFFRSPVHFELHIEFTREIFTKSSITCVAGR